MIQAARKEAAEAKTPFTGFKRPPEGQGASGVTGNANAKMLKTKRTWFGRLHLELQEECDIPKLVAAVSQGVKGSGNSGFEHKKGPGGEDPRGSDA